MDSSGDKGNKKRAKALEGYVRGATVTAACKYAGISRKTWYEWLKDPEFKAQVEAAENQVTDAIEQTAVEKACAGDTQLLTFMLKNRRRDKYAERIEVGATVDINGNAKHLLASRIAAITERKSKGQGTRKPD